MSGLLLEALRLFDLSGTEAEFLRHNENLTYRVDGRYLLRIHKPAEGLHVQHDPDIRRAELAFLRHLANTGLNVQRPIAEAVLPDGTGATLLTWLKGHSLTRDSMSLDVLRQAGELAFHMHDTACSFHHEALRRYDAEHVRSLRKMIRSMGERHHLNQDEISAADNAAQVIAERLDAVADAFIAIHCDLSASNLLLTPTGLAPIDFSLCGLGHPMHDLAILMGNIGSMAERQAVAEGYTQSGGHIDLPLLDAGLTLGLLEALAFHADTWPKEPWFAPRLTRWANEMLRPLADGKPLLDDNMYLLNIK